MFEEKLKDFCKQHLIDEKLLSLLLPFCKSYRQAFTAAGKNQDEADQLLCRFFELLKAQSKEPKRFHLFHTRVRHPINYEQFGLDFIRPLINFEKSKFNGRENVKKIEEQLKQKDNVILLANHQTEPDPQIIHLLLEKEFNQLASQMIFVAGHRVLEDPMAIPFSMGCNLLCIYSKRHINNPPEDKSRKVSHNQRTMKKMKELLDEGGKCIYIAPSGGRDRPGTNGQVDVTPFDADSIEMMRLIAMQASNHPTHFYPLALYTYEVLPPPPSIGTDLGEPRPVTFASAALGFGSELNMEEFPGAELDKKAKREKRAEYITNRVKSEYSKLFD